MNKKILVLLLVICIGFAFVGCKKVYTEDDVKGFAHPLTEKILLSLNSENYTSFSSDFNSDMQTALPEENFPSFVNQVKGVIGEYVQSSIKFVSAAQNGKYITVLYNAEYTEDSPVQVQISFEKVGSDYKVAGLYFDSAKLRGK